MVKSTSSSATFLSSSGNSANNPEQQLLQSSWARLHLTDSATLEAINRMNAERLRYLERSPLFIFPHYLCFYLNDPSSFRLELRIVNPYDWRINFSVLSTVARKYEVTPTRNSLGATCFVNISVRLLDFSPKNIGTRDALRVTVTTEDGVSMGFKDVFVHVLAERDEEEESRLRQLYGYSESLEEFIKNTCAQFVKDPVTIKQQPSTSKNDTQGAVSSTTSGQIKARPETNTYPPSFYIVVAIFCGIILCLPGEGESKLPTFLSVTNTPKLVAAYVLGILTSLICKFY